MSSDGKSVDIAASGPAISAKNLGKCYRIYQKPVDRLKQALWRGRKRFFQEFWALRHAEFTIYPGETVGIIGANGSGKSTLLQLICDILPPTEGELEVNGRVAALLELGAGFNPEFSGRENVMLNGAIMGLSQAEMDACYDDIVAFANIGDFIDRPVKTYSSGMYVRLAFATAINVSPDILVVDEALSVGDIRFQQKCMARIRKFCETGTVIFVSHDMAAITELCTRALWIEGGEIRMDGKPKAVVEKYVEFMYQDGITECLALEVPPDTEAASVAAPEIDKGFLPVPTDAPQFGDRRAVIEKVRLSGNGAGMGVIHSGKPCDISVLLVGHRDIERPIFGFYIKDRLGREIIGDNTALIGHNIPPLKQGGRYLLTIAIDRWPNLQSGDYTLSIAIADGTMEEHVQCHWLNDVIAFKSIAVRPSTALFSVLDTSVRFSELDG